MYVDCHSWFSSVILISKCGRLWNWPWRRCCERQKEKFSALCKWEAENHVTSREGTLLVSYSTVCINIINTQLWSWSWSCIIFCEKVWLVECHNFLNQHPKMIKISLIHGIIYQSSCWHLHFPFWIVSKSKLFLCSYSREPAAFQCTIRVLLQGRAICQVSDYSYNSMISL